MLGSASVSRIKSITREIPVRSEHPTISSRRPSQNVSKATLWLCSPEPKIPGGRWPMFSLATISVLASLRCVLTVTPKRASDRRPTGGASAASRPRLPAPRWSASTALTSGAAAAGTRTTGRSGA